MVVSYPSRDFTAWSSSRFTLHSSRIGKPGRIIEDETDSTRLDRRPIDPADVRGLPAVLKHQGLKFTTERAQILDAVLSTQGVFEADELLDEMRKMGNRVSKATIYRTLKHLVEANIIREVLIDAKQTHYELGYGRQPHGHLVCVDTNQIIEVDVPELAQIRDRICKEHGFDPVSHRFVVYGVSPAASGEEKSTMR